ncbi:MAG: nuclear transport factor 2 family protein [Myxococcota bacterium]
MSSDADRIARVVARFANCFDRKDWGELESLLADELALDYADLRGEVGAVSRASYVAKRRQALDSLATHHLLGNFEIEAARGSATCRASGVIYRRSGERRFDSHVLYEFGFVQLGADWLIASIRQRVLWSEGDPSIHSGAAAVPR